MEFSIEAKITLQGFLESRQLAKKTRVLANSKPHLLFENQVVTRYDVEVISQYHPLVRFVSEQLKAKGKAGGSYPVTAAEISHLHLHEISTGTYVYAISRWAVSGARDIERLEYTVKNYDTGAWLNSQVSETLVNATAMEGRDWLGAKTVLDHSNVAKTFDECLEKLEDGFGVFEGDIQRENNDRIHMMINTLERHRDKQLNKLAERIRLFQASDNEKKIRMIPAVNGQINKLNQKMEEKIAVLKKKQVVESNEGFVSGGVIRVY